MAKEYKLTISLKDETEKKPAKKALDKATGKDGEDSKSKKIRKEISSAMSAVKALSAYKVANTFVQGGKQLTNYYLGSVGSRYGDTARQNEINNIMSVGSRVTGAATSIAAGALVGGWAGAVIATVGEIVSNAVNVVTNKDKWNQQQRINDMNEIRQSERLGLLASDRNRGR